MLQLTATPKDGGGAQLSGRSIIWSSGAASVASVTSTGLVTGVSLGSTTITATSEGQSDTAGITVTPGEATQLVFTSQPSAATAGAPIAPAIVVTARDAQGNTATAFTGAVTVALGANPSGSTLSGMVTVTAAAGGATFSTLSIDKSGVGYTLLATSGGLTAATSVAINVAAGVATELVFTMQPSTMAAGDTIVPPIQVLARDAQGNAAIAFTGDVTVTIGANPGGGSLFGTTTVTAVAGAATFLNLSIDRLGTGYTLVIAAAGLTGATSAAFDVIPGAAAQLEFTVSPVTTSAGVTIVPHPQVTVRDAMGNTATGFTGDLTMGVGTNPAGGALSGVTTVAAVAGVATFSSLSINVAGSGYTLSATASGLTAAGSAAFDITPSAASHLVFTVQPSNATAGSPIPAMLVTARDAFGNTVPTFTDAVTIGITPGSGVGGATLAGTTTVPAVGGVATFSDLRIDKSAVGFTLTATATGLTGTISASFAIQAGPGTQVAFVVHPSTATAGATITPQIEVVVRDAMGNTADGFSDSVTVAIGTNPGAGILSGTTTVAASVGIAAFPDLSIDNAGAGYTLTAAASGTAGAVSAVFDVTAGQADRLVFSVQPTSTVAGSPVVPAVEVVAHDSLGNTVTSFVGDVTLSITAGSGTTGATLSGTTTVTATAGVAIFSDLSINHSGTGYELSATGGGIAGITSALFDVAPGPATQLVFTAQPSSVTVAMIFPTAVQVTAHDAQGNTATDFAGNVTVVIGDNPSGGTLSGTKTMAAVAGVASFADLSINRTGPGYTLQATSAPLATATSAPIDVTPGVATQLAFTVHPSNTAAGATITPAVQVMARDALGNTATAFTGDVTIALGSNPGGGTLSGTLTRAAVSGVAVFNDLSISQSGNGKRLVASSPGLSSSTSSSFNITAVTTVLVGAGDIAECGTTGDEATANLLDNVAGTVFTAGDNAYNDGSAANYAQCYAPSWGRHKARTRPSPGNHDYRTADATGYFDYFGSNAGPAGLGYYSYNFGNWHIVSLNSNISMSAGSTQEQWLRADLAASTKPCTLAYWHHPRFSSGSHHGSSTGPQPLWQALYDANAEIVVSGHEHNYERFAPQTPTGAADASRGIREFVVGTGGTDFYPSGTAIANSQVRNTG
ncbi:MAG: metallophosphoesterase, partial [Gemmatimonadales bacterium]